MKKITALVMAVVLAVSLAACGNTENSSGPQDSRTASQNREQTQAASRSEEGADGAADSGGRILIAYFAVAENSEVDAVASASVMTLDGEAMGITEALANMIADETGGDLFSIQTSTDYPADINDVIDYAAEEQDSNARPALTTHIENLEDYDTVFVGYPKMEQGYTWVSCGGQRNGARNFRKNSKKHWRSRWGSNRYGRIHGFPYQSKRGNDQPGPCFRRIDGNKKYADADLYCRTP